MINILNIYVKTYRIICAMPNMAVFCSALTSRFPVMLLTYFFIVIVINLKIILAREFKMP